jgi:hypothetical protein
MNLYAYCGDRATYAADPSGLDPNWTMDAIPEGQPNAGVKIRFIRRLRQKSRHEKYCYKSLILLDLC